VVLELDLASALALARTVGSLPASEVAAAAVERARAAGSRSDEALAEVGEAYYRMTVASDPLVDRIEALGNEALPLLEEKHDHGGLVHV
jgi:hypothetical protein